MLARNTTTPGPIESPASPLDRIARRRHARATRASYRRGGTVTGDTKPGKGRALYRDAGAAARAAITRALAASSLTPFDMNVFLVVIAEMTTYSKVTDEIGTRRLASLVYGVEAEAVVGWQRDRVALGLRRLHEAGVLVVETAVGRGARTRVTFPKASADALVLDDESQHERAGIADDDALAFSAKTSASERESQRVLTSKPARRVGHAEKYPEKTTEKEEAREGARARRRICVHRRRTRRRSRAR